MTGPIDESRHSRVYVSEDETRTYQPRPWIELTPDEQQTAREVEEIARWQACGHKPGARPRVGRRWAGGG